MLTIYKPNVVFQVSTIVEAPNVSKKQHTSEWVTFCLFLTHTFANTRTSMSLINHRKFRASKAMPQHIGRTPIYCRYPPGMVIERFCTYCKDKCGKTNFFFDCSQHFTARVLPSTWWNSQWYFNV